MALSHNLAPLDYKNLGDTIYTTLCDALIQGKFRPGERLKIRSLAEQLGTSVTPIRDAILKLVHDDALIFQSARDIRIPQLSLPRYKEIRSIRIKLEGLAAETAAQLATKQDIAVIKKILQENEKALALNDNVTCVRLNQTFHFMLTQIAQLPVLEGILRRLWLQMGPHISASYLKGGRDMVDYHYLVIEALEKHNSKDAAIAISNDIMLGGKVIQQEIECFQNTFR